MKKLLRHSILFCLLSIGLAVSAWGQGTGIPSAPAHKNPAPSTAQVPSAGSQAPAAPQKRTVSSEQKAARYFDSIKTQPPLLTAFIKDMPKGADLHNHLSGSIYAETFAKWAAEGDLCVNRETKALSPGPCNDQSIPAKVSLTNSILYRDMIDAWSMRNWRLSGQSGHDHFFDTFGKFGAVLNGRFGDMVAEATSRAAAEHVSYVEFMLTPDGGQASILAGNVKWEDDFPRMRDQLLAAGMAKAVDTARANLDDAEKARREIQKCAGDGKDPGCAVVTRYITQAGRGSQPGAVFAQLLLGFELASKDDRAVGVNLVQPEDGLVSMRDYSLQMRMVGYLRSVYPKVHVSLHAGELTAGLVPPEGLKFHVRESVQVAHADRVGHGVDIMLEDGSAALLREMAAKNVMVEICLSSNDGILGVRGNKHPLSAYLKYGVPVALATDDLGVARSDMNGEYLKAVEEQGLGYLTLKKMARTSLNHAFLPGESLWKPASGFSPVAHCAADMGGKTSPSGECRKFLDQNVKARLQWELESAFDRFEKTVPTVGKSE